MNTENNVNSDTNLSNDTNRIYDLLIIGGGPAGLTAALYAGRAGLSTAVFEGGMPGGKLTQTSDIENWPGERQIEGFTLATQIYEHAFAFGAEFINEPVDAITAPEAAGLPAPTAADAAAKTGNIADTAEAANRNFTVHTYNGSYIGRSVIIATGCREREIGIPGEKEYRGRGISYCAVCDGAFFRNKNLIAIGGGNTAFEEADYLTRFADKVTLVLRRDVARADRILQDRVAANPKIEVIYNRVPVTIEGDGMRVTQMLFAERNNPADILAIPADGIFPFVGIEPVTEFIDLPIKNEQGFIITDTEMRTAIPGLFAAGDCRVTPLRQIVTAAADGSIAAQAVGAYLNSIAH
ncbi:MAG: FAD-dependent oxidoreductase [Clostridiaceae bacterium]|nr:FAD-dependent oxidoreductase [Clostridiaceae bacterium]